MAKELIPIVIQVDEDDVEMCDACRASCSGWYERQELPPYCFEWSEQDPGPEEGDDTPGAKRPRFVCLHLIQWVGTDKAALRTCEARRPA